MRLTVDESLFVQQFEEFNRVGDKGNFSYYGCRKLYQYLTELEDSGCGEIELDVIALCCDYMEDTLENVLREYNLESIEELQYHTQVIDLGDGNIIYLNF